MLNYNGKSSFGIHVFCESNNACVLIIKISVRHLGRIYLLLQNFIFGVIGQLSTLSELQRGATRCFTEKTAEVAGIFIA